MVSRMPKIKRDKLTCLLKECFEKIYEENPNLICNCPMDYKVHSSERSIVFRFAYYLQKSIESEKELNQFVVDCEYNRDEYNIKKLKNICDEDEKNIFPDLIVHRRGCKNNANFLVIEFKTWWNKDTSYDEKKINGFLSQFNYMYGLSIIVEKELEDTIKHLQDDLKENFLE